MSLLELGDKKFTIPVGEVVLGSDASCTVLLAGSGVLPRHALLQGQADGQVVIRKATPAAEVLINGVRLGGEPTPLLHGDKVEIGNNELTFVDERRSGSTQFMQKVPVPEGAAQTKTAAKSGATGNTGGRVVSLTDGREYVITGKSLVFGREAGCDVVVGGKDVSRRHAEIMQTPKGYLLVDSSTNGTFVNEERVQGQRILQRTDVIRIGEENFRFYADLLASGPQPGPADSAPQAGPATPQPTGAPAAPRQAMPPPGADKRLQHTLHGMETAPPPRPSGPIANFLVKGGALKGQRLLVYTPVANIGRADYNDIVLPDPSVSTAHAKLQRREGVWVLVDLDSTNGTFVDGERVKGESPLVPGATVRFGEIQSVFEPTDDALGVAKGGGTQLLKTPHSMAPPAAAPAAAPKPPAPAPAPASARPKPVPRPKPGAKRPAGQQPPQKQGKGCGGGAAALLLAAAGAAVLLHRLLA